MSSLNSLNKTELLTKINAIIPRLTKASLIKLLQMLKTDKQAKKMKPNVPPAVTDVTDVTDMSNIEYGAYMGGDLKNMSAFSGEKTLRLTFDQYLKSFHAEEDGDYSILYHFFKTNKRGANIRYKVIKQVDGKMLCTKANGTESKDVYTLFIVD